MRTAPFNLVKAKAGHAVVTRDGREARIVAFDNKHHVYKIVALVLDDNEEYPSTFTLDGLFDSDEYENPKDLRMRLPDDLYYVDSGPMPGGFRVKLLTSNDTVCDHLDGDEAEHVCKLLNSNPLPRHENNTF